MRFSSLLKALTFVCLFSLLLSYTAPFVHPKTFKLLPIFGLGYPIILICTLLFLIFWTFLKSRMAIIIVFVLLIGGKMHFKIIALGAEPENIPELEKQLSIMSYNVRLFDLYNASPGHEGEKKSAIFNYLREKSPDVVCFQEFFQQDKPTNFPTKDSIVKILNTVDFHVKFAHTLKGRKNFGVAMFSKYPMIAKGDVLFEFQSPNDYNYTIYADIVKNSDTFRIYNVHLQSIRLENRELSIFEVEKPSSKPSTFRLLMDKLLVAFPKRADQARTIMQHIETSPYPTIVCGDFNDTPMSYTYHQFDKLLIDAFKSTKTGIGSTYVGKVPAGRIDYIFHSSQLQANGFEIQTDEITDHRAISCKIFKK